MKTAFLNTAFYQMQIFLFLEGKRKRRELGRLLKRFSSFFLS
jgi:hypothetical protein